MNSPPLSGRLDVPLPIGRGFSVLPDELRWRFSHSSGPGGQGVNTADSRVELIWNPMASTGFAAMDGPLQVRLLEGLSRHLVNGEIVIAVSEQRAQLRNRELARRRLAALLQAALAPPPPRRRPTRPTRGSIERRLAGKKARSATKESRSRPSGE